MTEETENLRRRRAFVRAILSLSDSPRRSLLKILALLFGIEVVLVLLHLFAVGTLAPLAAGTDDGHIGVLDLAEEGTLAVWFSSAQLLLLSLVSLFLSWMDRPKTAGRFRPGFWKLAAAVFLFMSIDETSVIHEMFGGTMNRSLPQVPLSASMWWTLPYALLLGLIFLFFCIRFFRRPGLLAVVFSGGFAWAGSTLLEHLHLFPESVNLLLEEVLEMGGATLLLGALGCFLMGSSQTGNSGPGGYS